LQLSTERVVDTVDGGLVAFSMPVSAGRATDRAVQGWALDSPLAPE
jgi:hypothetical protein